MDHFPFFPRSPAPLVGGVVHGGAAVPGAAHPDAHGGVPGAGGDHTAIVTLIGGTPFLHSERLPRFVYVFRARGAGNEPKRCTRQEK